MRPRTVAAVLVVVATLGSVAYVATNGAGSGNDVAVSERWVSDTGRSAGGNHHAVAAGRVDGEGMVFAPVSGVRGTDQCVLVTLSAADGSKGWSHQVPPANCTIHSVADPTLSDFDDDGRREVLAATTERKLLAFDAESGSTDLSHDLSKYGYSQPLVANLTGGPDEEVVVTDVGGTVFVLRPNGSVAWTHEFEDYTWSQPAVDDFDGDGTPELVVGPGQGGLYLFQSDGAIDWHRSGFDGSVTWAATGDLDDDPAVEVVVGTAGGEVAAVDGATGSVEWRRDYDGFAAVHAVGDGDGDGVTEVYAVANDGTLRALSGPTGETEWRTTLTTESVQMMPPPSLGDVDGDGTPELVAPAYDGSVSIVDPSSGAVVGSYRREAPIFTEATLADADGDGTVEPYVMYSDGRVVALSVQDGT